MVVHYSISDGGGGAGIAAYDIHRALKREGCKSKMVVQYKIGSDPDVKRVGGSRLDICKLKRGFSRLILKADPREKLGYHSLAIFSGPAGKKLKSEKDLVNLHWVQGEMLSIEDIGRIGSPFVWTLHDAWPFSGCEHLLDEVVEKRVREEYLSSGYMWPDLGHWCYQRKKRSFKGKGVLVAPSSWLAEKAKKSVLFEDWEVKVIPNVVDYSLFKPVEQVRYRREKGIDSEERVILAVSAWGSIDMNKGIASIAKMLEKLADGIEGRIRLVVVGSQKEQIVYLRDDRIIDYRRRISRYEMHEWYGVADCVIVGSRVESFGLVAAEASMCERPVICWDTSGLRDVVENGVNGVRVPMDNMNELIEAVTQVLCDSDKRRRFGKAGREKALALWSGDVVARRYMEVYDDCRRMKEDEK